MAGKNPLKAKYIGTFSMLHVLPYSHLLRAFPLPAVADCIHMEGGTNAAILEAVMHASFCLMSSEEVVHFPPLLFYSLLPVGEGNTHIFAGYV